MTQSVIGFRHRQEAHADRREARICDVDEQPPPASYMAFQPSRLHGDPRASRIGHPLMSDGEVQTWFSVAHAGIKQLYRSLWTMRKIVVDQALSDVLGAAAALRSTALAAQVVRPAYRQRWLLLPLRVNRLFRVSPLPRGVGGEPFWWRPLLSPGPRRPAPGRCLRLPGLETRASPRPNAGLDGGATFRFEVMRVGREEDAGRHLGKTISLHDYRHGPSGGSAPFRGR